MKRMILGAFGALLLVATGMFWLQGRAEVERGAPPPSPPPPSTPATLPSAGLGEATGPAPPEASELTREQRRFARYDRDHDQRITRTEMLLTRADAFRKLDKDGNNLLTFEEWAVATSDKFAGADANHDGALTPAEFRTTAPPPPKPKPACSCRKPSSHRAAARHGPAPRPSPSAPATKPAAVAPLQAGKRS